MLFDANSDPTDVWLHSERYLTIGSRTYSPFAELTEIPPRYRPESKRESFQVPTIWVEQRGDGTQAFNISFADNRLLAFYRTKHSFLFPIHPATLPLLPQATRKWVGEQPPGPALIVSPTSSSRTVFVRSIGAASASPLHFLKLHFPGRISRFVRSLTREDVLHQQSICRMLLPTDLCFLPEIAGGFVQIEGEASIGFLVRSFRPTCAASDCFTVPGFALYGIDRLSPQDPALISQLPQLFGESISDVVINRIVIPAVRLWAAIVTRVGIVPELHGQNILFRFDPRTRESQICFRDLDVSVDHRMRKALQLERPTLDQQDDCALDLATSEQLLSLSYDGFLVHHFLEPLARVAESGSLGVDPNRVRDAAKATFKSIEGKIPKLGRTAFYFNDVLFDGEAFQLVERPSFELWR